MKRVAIIGGGITGLTAAYHLQTARQTGLKVDFVLIEKEKRLGGKILTERTDGFIIDKGPDCFLSEKPGVIELAKKLDLVNRLLPSNEANKRTFILSSGKLHELPEGLVFMVPTKIWPFLSSRLISWRGKLRLAMEIFLPRGNIQRDESLASFIKRRFGTEALEKIVEPLIAGIHANEPEKMSLKSCFPRFLEMEQKYGSLIRGMLATQRKVQTGATFNGIRRTYFMSFRGGMADLTEALAKKIPPESIELGVQAVGIEYRSTLKSAIFRILCSNREPLEAEAVILTTPAFISAELIKSVKSDLASKLAEIPFVSSATVSLAYQAAELGQPLAGFGFVVPRTENRQIMATTWSSSKWADRAPKGFVLVRAFVGGARNQSLVELEDRGLINLVKREFKDILGISAAPVLVRVHRWRKGMPQYTLGHLDRVAEIEQQAANFPGLFFAGGSYRGVGIGDCIRSGEEAARLTLQHLAKLDN
jgi:oxygen-dependent protoporphyrinogen oxidase